MPIVYEDGFVPEEEHLLYTHHLKTVEKVEQLIGRTVKDIKLLEEYAIVLLIFEDGTEVEIAGNECSDFSFDITLPKKEENPERLEDGEYYFNEETGDLYMVSWKQNRPTGKGWMKIPKKLFEMVLGNILSRRKE